ncbi:MAG: hypothetical protein ACJ763_12305 [Bdellovibrionia bacterium]
MSSQTRFFHFSVYGFLGLMLISLSSCNTEMREICTGKYDHTVTDAISQLETHLNSDAAQRAVASFKEEASLPHAKLSSGLSSGLSSSWSDDERDRWQSWSQSELKKVEAYLDWTYLHRDLGEGGKDSEKTRRRLTDIANRLVAFHGYAQEGRVSRMLDTLKGIEADRKEVQLLVCRAR